MEADRNSPATPRAEVTAMADDWALIAALMGGTCAMRKAGRKYLPKHPAESDKAYDYRLLISTLFNGFRRTVETMSAKPFSEPLKLDDDVPALIREQCENIDLEGRALQPFAHEVFSEALAKGVSHILVDFPESGGARTRAEEKSAGLRPYLVHIKPEQVIGWRSENIAGTEVLTQFRFMECVKENDGEFSVKSIEQVRVLEPKQWRTYRKSERGEWVLHDEGPVSLSAIPLVPVYTGRTGFMTARPPLLDLAYLNIEHWQSSSDQSNILHVARVPILFGAGFGEDTEIRLGAGAAVSHSDPQAKLSYVEHTGAAIEAGRDSIKDIEDRMQVLGAQLLVRDQARGRTATEDTNDAREADSALSLMALALQDSLEQALSWMARWQKLGDNGGSVVVYREFDEAAPDHSDALFRGKVAGCWSAQTVFEQSKRLGIIDEELSWDDELERMKAEPPAAAVVGNFQQPPA
jgi:hypothetical protein